jgi:hypothetical protein
VKTCSYRASEPPGSPLTPYEYGLCEPAQIGPIRLAYTVGRNPAHGPVVSSSDLRGRAGGPETGQYRKYEIVVTRPYRTVSFGGLVGIMRSARLLMVAVLAVVVAALPIQSAFAGGTLSLDVSPTPVVLGQWFFLSGTESPISSGSTIDIVVYLGSTCITVFGLHGGTENNAGHYGIGIFADPAIYSAGQYSAQSHNSATGDVSPCDPFTVGTVAPPVGGVLTPANTFAIVAPWLAVIGLVGCIGTVVVVAKKRAAKTR